MKPGSWLTLVFSLLLLSGGCLRLEQEHPERSFFVLSIERMPLPAPTDGPTLYLQPLRILTPYNRSAFIYRYDAVTFEADYYNQFLSPPDQMLYGEMQRWLAASGLFAGVSGRGGDGLDTDYLLEGSVTELYGDYRLRTEPKAVMAIDLALYDGTRSALLWRRSYRQELPLAAATAPALAASWRQGLTLLLIELEEDMSQTLDAADMAR